MQTDSIHAPQERLGRDRAKRGSNTRGQTGNEAGKCPEAPDAQRAGQSGSKQSPIGQEADQRTAAHEWNRSPIRFFVPGVAKPGGSKTAGAVYKGGKPVMVNGRVLTVTREACKGNPAWRACVTAAARAAYQGPPLDEPLYLGVLFLIQRPTGHRSKKGGLVPSAPRHPAGMPDATKLMRAVEDAMKGILYIDDARCVRAWASKVYTLGQAGAWVTLVPSTYDPAEFARLMHYTA